MFALSDSQLRAVWNAVYRLPAEKRGIFLERMIGWLRFRGGRFIDRDFDDAVRLANAWADPRGGGLISGSQPPPSDEAFLRNSLPISRMAKSHEVIGCH